VTAAKKIITLLEKPMHVFGNKLTVDVSIAIVTCDTDKNILSKTLMQHADNAMYKAKNETGSFYYLWGSEI
jgi:GGDEF domain-containing protein